MDRDIFISYVEEDSAIARALAKDLRSLSHTTWTYEEDGVAGISYLTQVHRAIEGCRAFVLLASPASVNAHQVVREVEQAHEREKVIIAVRIGLSHQQFISTNPIVRMASGTAVTLAAGEGNLPAVAKRIAETLRFAEPLVGAETPFIQERVSSTPRVIAAPAPDALKQSPTNQAGVLRHGSDAFKPVPANDLAGGSTTETRSVFSPWLWLSVSLGVSGQLIWAGLWTNFVVNHLWPSYGTSFERYGTSFASFSQRYRIGLGLTLLILGSTITVFVCGVLLARSFVVTWRSSALSDTRLSSIKRYLLFTIVSANSGYVTFLVVNVINFGHVLTLSDLFPLFWPALWTALVWNGWRVLRRDS